MGRIITAPGVLTNVQRQIDHALDLYQDIKNNNMKPLTITLDPVTNANGSYTHITEDSRITEEMKAIAFEAGTPEVFLAPVTITTADGSATLTCSNAVGTSTVTVTFVHTWPVDGGEDVPERVTSTEFDILADRIGSLSTLETTDKTSIVNAINNFKSETDTHLTEVQDGLAIISNGDTHVAIPANQYVFVKKHNSLTNGLYKAKSAIGANAALSTSNLTADPAGGLNDIKSQIDTLNSKITPMGTCEPIDMNITADKTINHDFTKYRFVIIYYFSSSFYRQFVMYPNNIVTGSNKCGYDNLLTSDRCYCLKTSGASNSSIDLAVTIPASGTWAGGHFEMYGIK